LHYWPPMLDAKGQFATKKVPRLAFITGPAPLKDPPFITTGPQNVRTAMLSVRIIRKNFCSKYEVLPPGP
jgi:hypothetical protein